MLDLPQGKAVYTEEGKRLIISMTATAMIPHGEFLSSRYSSVLAIVKTAEMSNEDLGFYMILITLCGVLLHWGELSIVSAFRRGNVVDEVFTAISKDDKLNKVAVHASDIHAWTGHYGDKAAEPVYH